ncbi:MAG: trypsin-like peptidase domain-containing protein [Actinobacteria bacterium]|nr:trypsin-like peptidase domain-containing protein [Actinomycetota bacterium]
MDVGDGVGDDEPTAGWISPDDRLWRHPSEVADVAPRRSRRAEPRLWSVAVLAGLIASILTSAVIVAAGGFNKTVVRSSEILAPDTASPVALSNASPQVELIAERIRPSIVQIDVDTAGGRASGSGVVFRTDGHILTSHHLVDGARSIKVETSEGQQVDAKLVGGDKDTDIAVVKVEGVRGTAAPLGSAAKLKVGQIAVAIGEPLGLPGGPTVTVGVVSAVGRQVDRDGGSLLDMIQTDAPIAPGSSGGALVDGAGSVIGITTAIAVTEVGAEGLGFATPIDIARDVADQLITSGRVVHVWLGIEGEDLDHARAKAMKVPGGAVVKGVRGDSPAAHAGLTASDVIVGLQGRPVTSMAGLMIALRGLKPGQVVKLDVRRDGTKTRNMSATLVERPASLKN